MDLCTYCNCETFMKYSGFGMDIDLNDSVFELEAFVNNVGVGPAMDLVNCEGSGCEEVIECEGSTSEVAIESEGSREKEEE